MCMIVAQTEETYQEAERRKVLNKAKRFAPTGCWKIKTPKKVLRCDVCEFGKRKQAAYAHWRTGRLLCENHHY